VLWVGTKNRRFFPKHGLRSAFGIRGAEEKLRNKTRDESKMVGVARRLNVQVA